MCRLTLATSLYVLAIIAGWTALGQNASNAGKSNKESPLVQTHGAVGRHKRGTTRRTSEDVQSSNSILGKFCQIYENQSFG